MSGQLSDPAGTQVTYNGRGRVNLSLWHMLAGLKGDLIKNVVVSL